IIHRPGISRLIERARLEGMSNLAGVLDDVAAVVRGTRLSAIDIQAPVFVWHGKKDPKTHWIPMYAEARMMQRQSRFPVNATFLPEGGHHFIKDRGYLRDILVTLRDAPVAANPTDSRDEAYGGNVLKRKLLAARRAFSRRGFLQRMLRWIDEDKAALGTP